MKKLVLGFVVALLSISSINGQVSDQEADLMKSILKSEMKVYFAQNISLKTDQNKLFWEIYQLFEDELKPIVNARLSLLKDIMDNDAELPEAKIDEMINEAISLQKKRIAVRSKYYKMYKKKMGINIASQFYQLDQYINNLMAVALNEETPFVTPK